ncbi:hypothetical protein EV401DRAFT_1953309 [Pisolithus croceorrhizus]|nr:hypothetical protein EV401DRAFT_1953309 [Pisolithus croceorrhizus]
MWRFCSGETMLSARRPLLGSVTAVPSLSFLDACHGVRQSTITETGMPYLTEVHSRLMSIHTDGAGFVLNGLSTRAGRKPGMALKVKPAFRLSSVHHEMRALRFISKMFVQEAAYCVFSMAMTVAHDKSV